MPTPLSVADIALGEVASAVLSGVFASIGFVVVMLVLGLVVSPGHRGRDLRLAAGRLCVRRCRACRHDLLRDFSDFQLVQLVMLPMFLFATTFYPLSVYPTWARPMIEVLPLYQSIQLLREPALGIFDWILLEPVMYLTVFGTLALGLATRRLHRQLLP